MKEKWKIMQHTENDYKKNKLSLQWQGAVGSTVSLVLEVVSQFLVKLPWDGSPLPWTELWKNTHDQADNWTIELCLPGPSMFLKLPAISHKPANIDKHRTECWETDT